VDKELIWLLVPVFSLLYVIGGWKQKNWRRLGLPISLLAFGWLFGGLSWSLVASCLLLGAVLRLPFTLMGDSLYAWWGNWVWIWVVGYLFGASSLVLRFDLIAPLLPLAAQGIFGTLSNLRVSSRYFPWKWVEAIVGASVAYPYCLALS
jgi:hypothetical protein